MKKIWLLLTIITATSYTHAKQADTMEASRIIQVIRAIFEESDARRWEQVQASFASPLRLDYTSLSGGEPVTLTPQQLTDAWRQVLPGFYSTHHQVGHFKVDVQGDSATASCHGLALHYLPNGTPDNVWVVVGAYHFKLARINNNWKVNSMQLVLQKQAGNLQLPAQAQQQVQAGKQWPRTAVTPEARAAVEAFFTALEKPDIEAFMQAWDDKGLQRMPLSPEGFPQLLPNKAAIHNQYKSLPENYLGMRFPRKLFATDCPDVVIVQYSGIIQLKAGGEYNNNYVGVFRLAGGKVQEFTEYFDPFILQEAFGSQLQSNFNINPSNPEQ